MQSVSLAHANGSDCNTREKTHIQQIQTDFWRKSAKC